MADAHHARNHQMIASLPITDSEKAVLQLQNDFQLASWNLYVEYSDKQKVHLSNVSQRRGQPRL